MSSASLAAAHDVDAPASLTLAGPGSPRGMTTSEQPSPQADALPLTLMLRGRLVVLVGGGRVAARRAAAFVGAGAHLRVVSPHLCPELELLLGPEDEWLPRPFASGDLDGAWFVHTATGSTSVDVAVANEAERSRVFCINAGDAAEGSAAMPARATAETATGRVHVAVTSGDPRRSVAVARHVQGELESGRAPLAARRGRGSGGRVRSAETRAKCG